MYTETVELNFTACRSTTTSTSLLAQVSRFRFQAQQKTQLS